MVPPKSRLPRQGFRARGYRSIVTPFFSIKIKNNASEVNRIGVVVGKSVDKRATRRNIWERQAKIQLLSAPGKGKDIIMTIFPKINALTKKQFGEEVKKTLKTL